MRVAAASRDAFLLAPVPHFTPRGVTSADRSASPAAPGWETPARPPGVGGSQLGPCPQPPRNPRDGEDTASEAPGGGAGGWGGFHTHRRGGAPRLPEGRASAAVAPAPWVGSQPSRGPSDLRSSAASPLPPAQMGAGGGIPLLRAMSHLLLLLGSPTGSKSPARPKERGAGEWTGRAMGAGSLRKVKSQLRGCTGGCCSLGAGTLCLQCCGHSEHPAFPPKELSSELAVLHQGEATAAARDSAHPAPCHIALRAAG